MIRRRAIAASASEERLERLIRERLRPGADKEAIDARIWDLFGEEWCVMFTDLAGFSRNVARFGIIHFLQTISESERLLIPILEAEDGVLLKIEGDSMMVIFRSPMRGIDAALKMMARLAEYNTERAPEDQVLLCVGLGYGKVLRIGDADVYGHEVNAASKLGEDIARAGEVLITDAVREPLCGRPDLDFEAIQNPPVGTRAWRVKVVRSRDLEIH
ncbi:MAG: adenylate/guanylate cyclase domain-containing protein [Nannocystaceae bacterium]